MNYLKMSIIFVFVFLVFFLSGCASAATETAPVPDESTAIPPTPTPEALTCEDGTFSRFRLTNTKERNYSLSGSTCSLKPTDEGVIWVAVGEGLAMSDAPDKITFTNDQGVQFRHICWVDMGKFGGITGTRMLLVGPADSSNIMVCCDESCVQAQLED